VLEQQPGVIREVSRDDLRQNLVSQSKVSELILSQTEATETLERVVVAGCSIVKTD
jgi:hypothetical protein